MNIGENVKILGVQDWKEVVMGRDRWRPTKGCEATTSLEETLLFQNNC